MNATLKCKILEGELKGKRITIKFVTDMPDDSVTTNNKNGYSKTYDVATVQDMAVYLDDEMQTNVTGFKIEGSIDDKPVPQITLNMIDL